MALKRSFHVAFAALVLCPLLLEACSGILSKEVDMNVILELAPGKSTQLTGASKVVQKMVKSFPSLQLNCARLSITLVWKRVDVLTSLNCNYSNANKSGCYPTALKRLVEMERTEFSKPEYSVQYSKVNLIEAIEVGMTQLRSVEKGARAGARKFMILILSNPPQTGVIPTQDAVKDVHDYGIELEVVGVGNGQQEPLTHIVSHGHPIYQVTDLNMLSAMISDVILRLFAPGTTHDQVSAIQVGSAITSPSEEISSKERIAMENRRKCARRNKEFNNPAAAAKREKTLEDDFSNKTCDYQVDVGFLIDASGSICKYYEQELFFVKRIAAKFGLSDGGMHAGAVVFSAEGYVERRIPFNKHTEIKSFYSAVDNLPLYKYTTRIDLALTVANAQLFAPGSGSRPGIKKAVFLITDGKQQPTEDRYGVKLDPVKASEPLHEKGIPIFAIAVGKQTNAKELEAITRSRSRVIELNNFDDLINDDFLKNISKKVCNEAAKLETERPITKKLPTTARVTTRKSSPSTPTTPAATTATTMAATTTATTAATTTTTTATTTTTTPEPTTEAKQECKGCKCNECSEQGACKGCDSCLRRCGQKPAVYVNVFNGANGNNYVMQGAQVTQNGETNTMGSIGFKEISQKPSSTRLDTQKKAKNMSSSEIGKILKEWLPYQKKIDECVAELLRRSMAAKKKEGQKSK